MGDGIKASRQKVPDGGFQARFEMPDGVHVLTRPLNTHGDSYSRPSKQKFHPGDRIQCNYHGHGKWYPATFYGTDIYSGLYAVTYDDSPKCVKIQKQNVRHPKG